jgi:hypothetical protein
MILQPIVGKWPLDQIAPLDVTNPHAEEIVASVLRLSHVKHGEKWETSILKSVSVSQVVVLSSLDNHWPFRKPSILH